MNDFTEQDGFRAAMIWMRIAFGSGSLTLAKYNNSETVADGRGGVMFKGFNPSIDPNKGGAYAYLIIDLEKMQPIYAGISWKMVGSQRELNYLDDQYTGSPTEANGYSQLREDGRPQTRMIVILDEMPREEVCSDEWEEMSGIERRKFLNETLGRYEVDMIAAARERGLPLMNVGDGGITLNVSGKRVINLFNGETFQTLQEAAEQNGFTEARMGIMVRFARTRMLQGKRPFKSFRGEECFLYERDFKVLLDLIGVGTEALEQSIDAKTKDFKRTWAGFIDERLSTWLLDCGDEFYTKPEKACVGTKLIDVTTGEVYPTMIVAGHSFGLARNTIAGYTREFERSVIGMTKDEIKRQSLIVRTGYGLMRLSEFESIEGTYKRTPPKYNFSGEMI